MDTHERLSDLTREHLAATPARKLAIEREVATLTDGHYACPIDGAPGCACWTCCSYGEREGVRDDG